MSKRSFIILFLAISTLSFGCDSAAPPRPIEGSAATTQAASALRTAPEPDQQAILSAQNVEIEKLDGKTFKLADYRGKVIVVDFWATYCPPCVRQVPELAKLNNRYRDRGLVVVGLTSDDKEDQSKVTEFLKKAGADYVVGYDNRWLSSAFLKGTEDETGAPPIPQLFVLSREGRVVEHMIGDSPQRGIEHLERVVNEQLNGASK